MNSDDPRFAALDTRMHQVMAGLDTPPGFEARVMHRIAAQAARTGTASANLRAQFERRQELARRRLRREAWSNAITIAGIGIAGFALVWRYSAEIVQWVTASDLSMTNGPVALIGVALAAVGAALWPFRGRMAGRLK